MVSLLLQMGENTLVNMLEIRNMAKVLLSGLMVASTLADGKMDFNIIVVY